MGIICSSRRPLLNDYVEKANEHLVIRDEHRLKEVLFTDEQFILETDRGKFKSYSAIRMRKRR